jgi:hypothetical protein
LEIGCFSFSWRRFANLEGLVPKMSSCVPLLTFVIENLAKVVHISKDGFAHAIKKIKFHAGCNEWLFVTAPERG